MSTRRRKIRWFWCNGHLGLGRGENSALDFRVCVSWEEVFLSIAKTKRLGFMSIYPFYEYEYILASGIFLDSIITLPPPSLSSVNGLEKQFIALRIPLIATF